MAQKKARPSRTRRLAAPTPAVHTLYVRDFPQALTRQVRAAALLRGVPINEMLTILVRDALAQYKASLEPPAPPVTKPSEPAE